MYYPTMVAYYMFFNPSKVLYVMSLLVLACFYMFTTLPCNDDVDKFRTSLMCLQLQGVTNSNSSLFCLDSWLVYDDL